VVMGNLVACPDVVIWAIDLKRGMELGPWAACIDQLATTPDQARVLLADAVAIVQARAAELAAEGRRTWEPSPDAPALIIVIDEYAELADDATEAMPDADTVARLGRAVAVTLIAATQRPTQKAMGQGAVRSQMDLRIAFRVRERKDVDLILGQGMLAAGWQAHTLNAPGKFLVSDPEHTTPKRARAYLVTDQAVTDTAERYANQRPGLDDTSQQAMQTGPTTPADPSHNTGSADPAPPDADPGGTEPTADDALWLALCLAPDEGTDVAELLRVTGMSRPTLYRRLADHAKAGRATQVSRGRWRAQMTQEPPRD
jgi:DNA segregation ATPase FtsK/SpoIIIE-like protein